MTPTLLAPTRPTPAYRRPRGRRAVPLALAFAGAALVLAGCGGGGSSASPSSSAGTTSPAKASGAVVATASTGLGTVLVDDRGMTVYMFAADSPGHSACTGACLSYWPVVTAPSSLPASVPGVTAKLGVLTRSDGTRQLTVAGHPVYTYAGDTSAGMTSGQGVNASGGLWWVLSPAGSVITAATSGTPSPSTSATSSGSTGGGWG